MNNYITKEIQRLEAQLQQLNNSYQATFGAIQALRQLHANLQTPTPADTSSSIVAVFPDGIEVSSPPIGGDVK